MWHRTRRSGPLVPSDAHSTRARPVAAPFSALEILSRIRKFRLASSVCAHMPRRNIALPPHAPSGSAVPRRPTVHTASFGLASTQIRPTHRCPRGVAIKCPIVDTASHQCLLIVMSLHSHALVELRQLHVHPTRLLPRRLWGQIPNVRPKRSCTPFDAHSSPLSTCKVLDLFKLNSVWQSNHSNSGSGTKISIRCYMPPGLV